MKRIKRNVKPQATEQWPRSRSARVVGRSNIQLLSLSYPSKNWRKSWLAAPEDGRTPRTSRPEVAPKTISKLQVSGWHRESAWDIRINHLALLLALCVLCAGCRPHKAAEQSPEPTATTDKVSLATNSPQLEALTVERVGAGQPAFVPLTGRLVWDEGATVRVFSPFAGIVRKLLVEVNQRVSQGTP
ncbi:MAG: rane fusion protein heavy metal efflux system, partial [Verrucomicrobiota bacterium]